jgi:U3 small nucleolar RNA-associated protein 11
MTLATPDEETIIKFNKEREKSYKELDQRLERERELSVVQRKLELKRVLKQKRLMEPKRLQKGTKDKAPVYEFRFERKR